MLQNHNPCVGGSNPSSATRKTNKINDLSKFSAKFYLHPNSPKFATYTQFSIFDSCHNCAHAKLINSCKKGYVIL